MAVEEETEVEEERVKLLCKQTGTREKEVQKTFEFEK